MVEFWTSLGLACFNKRFLDGLLNDADGTIRKEMLRLSCLEFTELKRILSDPKIVEQMRVLQGLGDNKRMCPLYPRPCPPPGRAAELFAAWFKEFEAFLGSQKG